LVYQFGCKTEIYYKYGQTTEIINKQKGKFSMNNFEVLTAQDISKVLKVSRATAYEIMERDDFPTIRIGRNKRVMAHEFLKWIENQTNKRTA